ncbi:hypothetical protein PRIPAC_97067, partial [Pristionchus pacificus]
KGESIGTGPFTGINIQATCDAPCEELLLVDTCAKFTTCENSVVLQTPYGIKCNSPDYVLSIKWVHSSSLTCKKGVWDGEVSWTEDGPFPIDSTSPITCVKTTCSTPTLSTTICMTSDGCSSTDLQPSGTKYSCGSGQTLVASDSNLSNSRQKTSENKIECVDGWWRAVVDENAQPDPNNLYLPFDFHAKDAWLSCSAGVLLCTAAVPDNAICPSSDFCDASPLMKTLSEASCPSGLTLYASSEATPESGTPVVGKLTCTGGTWTGMVGTTHKTWNNVFVTCQRRVVDSCVNPIKTETICPPPSICDMSQITTNGKFVTCTNNAQLFVSATPNSIGKPVSGNNGIHCENDGNWHGSLTSLDTSYNEPIAYVTCENKAAMQGDNNCKNCPGVPYAPPTNTDRFIEVFNFTGTENYGFPCTTVWCPTGSMIYFGGTYTAFTQQYAMCQATRKWNIQIGVGWANYTNGAYCAKSKCPQLTFLNTCKDSWRNCDDKVDYGANDHYRCTSNGAKVTVFDDDDHSFTLSSSGENLRCNQTSGRWYDENKKQLFFNPTKYQCSFGCASPTYSTNVCPTSSANCNSNNNQLQPNQSFSCSGRKIYVSTTNSDTNPGYATQQFNCNAETGEWTTSAYTPSDSSSSSSKSFKAPFFFACAAN